MKRMPDRRKDWMQILKAAPGDLKIVQAFVNSVDLQAKKEQLSSPRSLGDWLASWGLMDAGAELGQEDLRRALEVRKGLRALLAANNGAVLDEAVAERLGQAAGAARFQVVYAFDGPARFVPVSRGFDDALGRLIEIVVTARLEGTWPRFKACANGACRAAFYDFSKNRSARWCTMRRCGAKLKSRAQRRKTQLGS